jgi:hypothetical protein
MGTRRSDSGKKAANFMLPLESLTIHQFRGLRDVELRGLGRFNVLVGLNNSGKTSVLEAIATYARPLRPSEWVDVVRRRDVTYSRAVLLEGLRWLFPQQEGGVDRAKPFIGATTISGTGSFCAWAFVFPDNTRQGVVEHLVLECGTAAYPDLLSRAHAYVGTFGRDDRKQAKWAPYDEQKAVVASVASLLKPGKTNTASLADNLWVSDRTRHLPMLSALLAFSRALFQLSG